MRKQVGVFVVVDVVDVINDFNVVDDDYNVDYDVVDVDDDDVIDDDDIVVVVDDDDDYDDDDDDDDDYDYDDDDDDDDDYDDDDVDVVDDGDDDDVVVVVNVHYHLFFMTEIDSFGLIHMGQETFVFTVSF